MPAPEDDDPRWSLELAGGALMDLGCYGLHVMRRLGHPSIVRAHAEQRSPGVDAWCDVDLAFPGGATGLSANSMVADDYSFTLRIVGTHGDMLVHNFIKPHDDDRLTINTAEGTTVERLGTRPSYTYQLEAFAAPCAARGPATARHRRRGGEHGLRRRRVPRGGHDPALNRRRAAEAAGQLARAASRNCVRLSQRWSWTDCARWPLGITDPSITNRLL